MDITKYRVQHNDIVSRNHGPGKTCDQATDECNCDDHGSGCDHRNRDCVQELSFGQPMIFMNHTVMKKWNDGQTAAEHKSSGRRKIEGDV